MINDTEKLLKGSKVAKKQSKVAAEFNHSKEKIKNICISLSYDSIRFNPKLVVNNINQYINSGKGIERILYSEISNYIFELDYDELPTFSSNIDTLMDYILKNGNELSEKCIDFVIKLYDHCQLAFHQVENTRDLFDENIENVKERLQVDVNEMEKEYITILGIFASIVLAFVGGLVFSNSILRYISSISIFRLVLVIDLLGVVLITVIYLLMQFIMSINDSYFFGFNIKWLYVIAGLIAVLDIAAWGVSANRIADFLRYFMPWG